MFKTRHVWRKSVQATVNAPTAKKRKWTRRRLFFFGGGVLWVSAVACTIYFTVVHIE